MSPVYRPDRVTVEAITGVRSGLRHVWENQKARGVVEAWFGHNFFGGGWAHPRYAAICRCRTGQFAAMRPAKCGKFSAYVRHNFRPVTHYGMVIKRWNIAENNTYYEATDTLGDLFFKIWANDRFSSLKMQGGPDELGNFSYLGQRDLK